MRLLVKDDTPVTDAIAEILTGIRDCCHGKYHGIIKRQVISAHDILKMRYVNIHADIVLRIIERMKKSKVLSPLPMFHINIFHGTLQSSLELMYIIECISIYILLQFSLLVLLYYNR